MPGCGLDRKNPEMVDGAKLDTARDSVNVNANRKERKEENHYKSKSTRTPTKEIENSSRY